MSMQEVSRETTYMARVQIVHIIMDYKAPFTAAELYQKLKTYPSFNGDMECVLDILYDLDSHDLIHRDVYENKYYTKAAQELPEKRILRPGKNSEDVYKQSDFTSYEFICLFSALLMADGIDHFNFESLKTVIEELKKQKKYSELLYEFNINKKEDYIMSLEDAINDARREVILLSSPNDPYKLYISSHINIKAIVITKIDYFVSMTRLKNEYRTFVTRQIAQKPVDENKIFKKTM